MSSCRLHHVVNFAAGRAPSVVGVAIPGSNSLLGGSDLPIVGRAGARHWWCRRDPLLSASQEKREEDYRKCGDDDSDLFATSPPGLPTVFGTSSHAIILEPRGDR